MRIRQKILVAVGLTALLVVGLTLVVPQGWGKLVVAMGAIALVSIVPILLVQDEGDNDGRRPLSEIKRQ